MPYLTGKVVHHITRDFKRNRMIRTFLKYTAFIIGLFFLLPMAVAAGWWSQVDRPANWRSADWESSGVLPGAKVSDDAAIYVMAARTGGFKGAFSVHTWLVIERPNEDVYTRYEKVGWGSPIRIDAYAADANWYSNRPEVIKAVHGKQAADLVADVERAIGNYPFNNRGDYHIWPGPNSNSFVAHVLREVPALGAVLPPHAVGRDYLGPDRWYSVDPDGQDFHVNFGGYAGFSVGVRSGLELNVLGQTFGIDISRPAFKMPAIGRIGMAL